MNVYFGQIYIEPGVSFPFNHLFQRCLAEEITLLVDPSPKFTAKWGKDFDLIFRISAKKSIQDIEIKGPTVFKANKDVEYTIFLPFDVITSQPEVLRSALTLLVTGMCSVFNLLEIDATKVLESKATIVATYCNEQFLKR